MFQDTRVSVGSSQSQDPNKEKLDQQERQARAHQNRVAEATKETRERLAHEAAVWHQHIKQQVADREVQAILKQERAGASADAVASKAFESVAPSLDHDLSKVEVPFNEDNRGKLREEVRQKLMHAAKPIDVERQEQAERLEREKRAEKDDAQKNRLF